MMRRFTRDHLIWSAFCVLSGGLFLIYLPASLAAGRGQPLLPLDDVYIHFQYARQLAGGQPFIYNPGQPPTSGATSFLYPFVLASGYVVGFQGLNLGFWALAVGAAALAVSGWLIYRLMRDAGAAEWLGVGMGLIFMLTGPVNWHFFSGMETGLAVLFSLATFYTLISYRFHRFVICGSLLVLTRPEGGILAALAVGAAFLQMCAGAWTQDRASLRARRLFLAVPLLALVVQPALNGLATGSFVASGSAAKSILSAVPFYWHEALGRILSNAFRTGVEFVTGYSAREGWYLPVPLGFLALVALLWLLRRREKRWIALLLFSWLVLGTGVVATLDTAFWHFKRYQMPLIALLFPLAGWGIEAFSKRAKSCGDAGNRSPRRSFEDAVSRGSRLLLAAMLLMALWTGSAFIQHFALNVDYVYRQPYQMARWLQENTPENALVAVHDVGLMRYLGGRTTLDMVGLTTPGAARYWRSGPGAVAEYLMRSRPDFIASYGHGHGYGLGMLADTSLFGEPLVSFRVTPDPHFNVALAADIQGIYRPDWQTMRRELDDSDPMGQIINVADLDSEQQAQYQWSDRAQHPGFPTYVEELADPSCSVGRCVRVVAGRHIDGEESFVVAAEPGVSMSLMTYVHAFQRGVLAVYVDGALADRSWIPEMPSYGLFVPSYLPGDLFLSSQARIRIVAEGDYFPAFHRISQISAPPQFEDVALAVYQSGAILLTGAAAVSGQVTLDWYSDGSAQGDYKLFVHILDSNGQIVAQADAYPGGNSLPPGNWLPGPRRDSIVVNLAAVLPGKYRVALGLYNPYTNERLTPESDWLEVSEGRLFLGEIDVE